MNRYGFEKADWDAGKAEVKQILARRASLRGMIPYGELSKALRTIQIGPHDPAMAAILGQVSEEEDAEGRGMLSVIVVHKDGDLEPGAGFYECAAGLGKDVSDRMKFWVDELHKVHGYWSNKDVYRAKVGTRHTAPLKGRL